MAKNRYFLVSRDLKINEVKCIPFRINNGDELIENDLNDIDLFTTKFKDKSELVVYLHNNGIINSYDSDIFIVSRNGDCINTMECIYGRGYFNHELQNIALSKKNNIDDVKDICYIFDEFSRKMFFEDDFYTFITYGFTDIYPKFIDYYKECRDLDEAFNCKLRDGSWAMKSYHLIHNIVSAYAAYRKRNSKLFDGAMDREKLYKDRCDVFDDIRNLTERGYVDGQFSLFGEKYEVNKKEYVLSSLNNLRIEAFIEDNGTIFNSDFFNIYEGEAFKRELTSILDSDSLGCLLNYAKDLKLFRSSQDYALSDFKLRLEKDKLLLSRALDVNCDFLNRVYSFFLLYNKCMRDNGMDSGEYGRSYSKK